MQYCGLLEASVAAHERARALDPLIPTSVVQTHWMLGDFDKAIPAFASGTNGFFPGLAQLSLGRPAEALAIARAAVASDPLVRSYQSILPFVIEGRTDECLALLDALAPRNPDPESVFYIARTYAHLGATDRALAQFDRAVNMGFFCWPTFTRDVWLDSIRDEPAFAATMARAQARHDEALGKFRDAGGERLLGLSANASSSAAHRPQG